MTMSGGAGSGGRAHGHLAEDAHTVTRGRKFGAKRSSAGRVLLTSGAWVDDSTARYRGPSVSSAREDRCSPPKCGSGNHVVRGAVATVLHQAAVFADYRCAGG